MQIQVEYSKIAPEWRPLPRFDPKDPSASSGVEAVRFVVSNAGVSFGHKVISEQRPLPRFDPKVPFASIGVETLRVFGLM